MDEKIIKCIEKYEDVRREKAALEQRLEEVKANIKDREQAVCESISDAGHAFVEWEGYKYTPGIKHKYYLNKSADVTELGIEDVYEPFEQNAFLHDLVHKEITWTSLQTAMKELEETEEGIPDDVRAVLLVQDEFGISRRKVDTTSKNKVANALAKKRSK